MDVITFCHVFLLNDFTKDLQRLIEANVKLEKERNQTTDSAAANGVRMRVRDQSLRSMVVILFPRSNELCLVVAGGT